MKKLLSPLLVLLSLGLVSQPLAADLRVDDRVDRRDDRRDYRQDDRWDDHRRVRVQPIVVPRQKGY